MSTYLCFWRGKQLEVNAPTSYAAQLKAAEHWKVKKAYEIAVTLAAKDGVEIIHTPVD